MRPSMLAGSSVMARGQVWEFNLGWARERRPRAVVVVGRSVGVIVIIRSSREGHWRECRSGTLWCRQLRGRR